MLKLKMWLKHAYILVHVCLFDSDLLVVFFFCFFFLFCFGKFCLFIHLFAYLTVFVLFILLVCLVHFLFV